MGFAQAQINRYKQRFHRHGKHSLLPEPAKDTLPSLPATAHETTQQQQLVPSSRRPRTAENVSSSVFESAGLPALMREGISSPQLILWRVRRRRCAGCGCTTVSVQPVASCDINLLTHRLWPSSASSSSLHHSDAHARGALCDHGGHVGASSSAVRPQQSRYINTATGRVVLPPSVYPSSTSMAVRGWASNLGGGGCVRECFCINTLTLCVNEISRDGIRSSCPNKIKSISEFFVPSPGFAAITVFAGGVARQRTPENDQTNIVSQAPRAELVSF